MNEHIASSELALPLFATRREQFVVFFLVFMGVFSLTFGFFYIIDFLPEKPYTETSNRALTLDADTKASEDNENLSGGAAIQTEPVDPYPTRIIFDSFKREVAVLNPESRSITALDTALLSGVVRHPDSADFERTGTIFLFGHSSYLPNVLNKNFQAFNGIQKLVWGDVVRLQSSDTEYVYRVDRVYEAGATDAEVKIETGKPRLTLVTCNSFGSKDDRFIVEATLVEERSLKDANELGMN